MDGLALGDEHLLPAGEVDVDRGPLDDGIGHLAGQSALEDQLVEALFVGFTGHLRAGHVGGADGLVCFLCAGVLGFERAQFVVLLAVGADDVVAGAVKGDVGQVGGIRPHVGDASGFVEALGDLHGAGNAEAQFPSGFLLECRGGERGRGLPLRGLAFDAVGLEVGAVGGLQDGLCRIRVADALVEFGLEGLTCSGELGRYLIVTLRLEGEDLAFPVHDQPDRHALDTTGREGGADLLPQDR